MGVSPRGAKVRRRVGLSMKPDSSVKISQAPLRRAFFYAREMVALPLRNRRLITLACSHRWHLARPAQTALHDLAHMLHVISLTKMTDNKQPDASSRPELVWPAMGSGTLSQEDFQTVLVFSAETSRPTRMRPGRQAIRGTDVLIMPLIDGRARAAEKFCNLGWGLALLP
jgi:hypothetical protein